MTLPPMTGNGKFIPPIKMVMTGGWFMALCYPHYSNIDQAYKRTTDRTGMFLAILVGAYFSFLSFLGCPSCFCYKWGYIMIYLRTSCDNKKTCKVYKIGHGRFFFWPWVESLRPGLRNMLLMDDHPSNMMPCTVAILLSPRNGKRLQKTNWKDSPFFLAG